MANNELKNQPYLPIDCSFHDQLLELATFKKIVDIEYFNKSGEKTKIESIIKDVFITKTKEEFLVDRNGNTIRLDKLIKAGPYSSSRFNSCETK